MNVDQYRADVVDAVDCEECGSAAGSKCRHMYAVGSVSKLEISYLHDCRSAAYLEHVVQVTIYSTLPVPPKPEVAKTPPEHPWHRDK